MGETSSFNGYDLLILDWLIICFIIPKLVVIPGTEGNEGYKDYWFHFVGFLKGIGITLVMSLVNSGIIEFKVKGVIRVDLKKTPSLRYRIVTVQTLLLPPGPMAHAQSKGWRVGRRTDCTGTFGNFYFLY